MTNLKILIAIILICALLSSPKAAFAQAADLGVFNPSKVDWWVSMDDSIISNQQNCEVHWLFDDSLDVSLSVSDAYRLFFTFRVRPEGKEVTPPLQLRKGMADKASLMVEDVSHPLGITEIDVHPAMVVMGIPDLLNNLSYRGPLFICPLKHNVLFIPISEGRSGPLFGMRSKEIGSSVFNLNRSSSLF